MLDKDGNFIKLKMAVKNPQNTLGMGSGTKQIVFQGRRPVALAVKKAENMDGLLGFFDLVKEKIVLDSNGTDAEARQKRVTDKGNAGRKFFQRVDDFERFCQELPRRSGIF